MKKEECGGGVGGKHWRVMWQQLRRRWRWLAQSSGVNQLVLLLNCHPFSKCNWMAIISSAPAAGCFSFYCCHVVNLKPFTGNSVEEGKLSFLRSCNLSLSVQFGLIIPDWLYPPLSPAHHPTTTYYRIQSSAIRVTSGEEFRRQHYIEGHRHRRFFW